MREQVWFFRLFIVFVIICVYRVLLQYVLKYCPNPFCSKCLGSGTMRERVIRILEGNDFNSYRVGETKESKEEAERLNTLVLTNLLEHKRLLSKNIEKPTIYYHRGLSSTLYYIEHANLLKTYRDCAILLDKYDMLRQELIILLQQNNGKWKIDPINKRSLFYLYENGTENELNCKLMPQTFELLQTLPNAIISNADCLFANVMITCLDPMILPSDTQEYGVTNCRIRCHLGLQCIAQDSDNKEVYIVANKYKRLPLENNHMVAYNDSAAHQYVNNTNYKQYILTVDLWHPDLSTSMRKHLAKVFHSRLST
ncbi:unnamed protein product [Didymodactylos carnosus]|uniref:Aspartyl/asparaginy/proline hydroxylase domain-containing protein n=1 Tax=Didymodactylos carnosus TaxID=1234261 RepID=A0A8S2REC0_9BILA|nr:unnamed protein product [Didymodactylos carnosus]CAF4158506.1 unnamed protein product [Didymodactylos carnosus]